MGYLVLGSALEMVSALLQLGQTMIAQSVVA